MAERQDVHESDEEGDEQEQDVHREHPRQAIPQVLPLEGLLRLLAGERVVLQRRAEVPNGNAELIEGLKRTGMLTSESVTRVMLAVPRGMFVPRRYAVDAWLDSPIRVEEEDFNISAPHMHAQMLEALDVAQGDRFLDIGCGCGYLTACAARLVGRGGHVVGIDTKSACVALSSSNIARLTEQSPECDIPALTLPAAHAVPEERLHLLLQLLDPAGGRLLAPVDSELRLYTRAPGGALRHRVVSAVRFSDLEVPGDSSIALSVLQSERAARLEVSVSPSSLTQDLGTALTAPHQLGCSGGLLQAVSSCFSGSSGDSSNGSSSMQHEAAGVGAQPLDKEAAGGTNGDQELTAPVPAECMMPQEDDGVAAGLPGIPPAPLDLPSKESWKTGPGALGQPDCTLQGSGWTLRAHTHVLRTRAAHFAARLSSGMRDAHNGQHQVPDSFSAATIRGLLHYLYSDSLPPGLEPQDVIALLRAGAYYGTPRLLELCQAALMNALLGMPLKQAANEAPHLLCVAEELGLSQLCRSAAAFIAHNLEECRVGDGWQYLERPQLELVTSELSGELTRMMELLKQLEPPSGAERPAMRHWW